ncbi:hypothetical protein MFUM_700144 [Methylacidiphilum fumariolicum SolV]|uniref:Uncharacterized protein n=2 Tax=Candidatus Methylacidiphilum fumarolicum TaxID=591154 RepID=I0JZC1_METFB|nr:conserved protein of unknown function [Candidatus Methylacidiphilum fumarolicum]CCG92590.1 hypothetical protein MFUM_700144 [Methylacidiphilum fumariolicum SolV]
MDESERNVDRFWKVKSAAILNIAAIERERAAKVRNHNFSENFSGCPLCP